MARIPTSAHGDPAETLSARHGSTPAHAQIAGFESDAVDAPSTLPWHPAGQRAHHVRKLLDGYTAGRNTALRELENRTAP